MTVREHYETLNEETNTKYSEYQQADKEATKEMNGFFERKVLDNLTKKWDEYLKSLDKLYKFGQYISENNLNFDEVYE